MQQSTVTAVGANDVLTRLAAELQSRAALIEIAYLLVCLGLAYGVSWWLGRRVEVIPLADEPNAVSESIWFGRRTLDGVLFPVLSLALVYAVKKWLDATNPVAGQAAAVLTLAVPVLMSLTVIRFCARVLTTVFPDSDAARTLEQGLSWLAWGATVLWILGLLPPVLTELDAIHFSFGKTKITLRMILEGVLSSIVVMMLALWLAGGIEKRLLSPAVKDLSMRKAAANAVRGILLLVGLLIALSAVGVDLTALSVMGGALGVGLGLGLQKLASNYVSGFVILLERSLRIGDTVKVDDFEGRITDIKTRYTLIRSTSGRESVVPNEKLITERIENLSLADSNVAVAAHIVVGYDSDVAQVQAILCNAALAQARVLKTPEPAAMLSSFAADGIEFTLVFWIADPQHGLPNVRSDVHIAMLHGLRAAGVEIPFAQRVVRVVGAAGLVPVIGSA